MTCPSISACRRFSSSSAATALAPDSAKDLYRDLVRKIKQLPKDAQQYYKNYTRQVFYNFTEERDPETLTRLHSKAREDAEWVLKKYSK
uniref:LYR motif-containing protein 9 n=1 Tax=Tetradesmus obliquus TaxID=3088 RepID=A0A383WCJ0_TETOB|eukprot:jgi/Sobl393_1/16714/SZX74416.1